MDDNCRTFAGCDVSAQSTGSLTTLVPLAFTGKLPNELTSPQLWIELAETAC
ncbi:MAG TPA: hypothetical protein VGI60_01225 [Chthoniobacterales bacterium]